MNGARNFLFGKITNLAAFILSVSILVFAFAYWNRTPNATAQAVKTNSRMPEKMQKEVLYALEDAFVSIAENVQPAVVTITARSNVTARPRNRDEGDRRGGDREEDGNGRRRGRSPLDDLPGQFRDFFRDREPGDFQGGPSTGSGVIIEQRGRDVYVLTNNHVVRGRDKFRVQMHGGAEHLAVLVGTDEKADLAVIKFRPAKQLPPTAIAKMGDSDKVRKGHWAIAIGSPLGYDFTITVGVISALGRDLPGLGRTGGYSDLIQTDASINPGNSGGPLVNIDGEVIGINVAIASAPGAMGNIGIGFAIPVNTAKMVSKQLVEHGKVTRGYLGVATVHRDIPAELREILQAPEGGALVENVSPDSPAARAGVQEEDVIVRFGKKRIGNFRDLEAAVAITVPGKTVATEVIRKGKLETVHIKVVVRPAESELRQPVQAAPGKPAPDSKEVKSRFGLTIQDAAGGKGVYVVAANRSSTGAEAGIECGQIITSVNGRAVANVAEFEAALKQVPKGQRPVFKLRTRAGLRFAIIHP